MKHIFFIIFSLFCTMLYADSPEKLYLEGENETCLKNDGKITATIGSGTLPMTFTWSTGEVNTVNAFSNSIDGLAAGNYTCAVQDAHGCRAVESIDLILERDSIPPVAGCKDITVALDENGQVKIEAEDIDDNSTDNCVIDSMTISQSEFDCYDLGSNQIVLTVTDEEGYVGTCEATVTVEDTLAPDAKCMDITVALDSSGQVTITADDVDNGSTDECGIDSKSVDPEQFSCSDLGENEVTLTVTDESGNEGTCSATVTVEDNMPPEAKCKDISVSLGSSGSVSITAGSVDDGSTDNCSIDSMTVSPSEFSCSDLGSNSVTLTVYDKAGNQASCTATVTVEGDCCQGTVYDPSTEQCCEETDENPGIQPIDVECNPPSGSGSGTDSTSTQKIKSSIEVDKVYYQSLSIEAYPNPVNDVLNLQAKSPASGVSLIGIYNIRGEQVYEISSYMIKGDYNRQIRLPDSIPSGTYIINVKVGDFTATEKIILLKP